MPLLRPGFDKAGYQIYLGRLLGFQRPIEERLSAFGGALAAYGLDLAPRNKAALLERDLAALGTLRSEIAALPVCAVLPAAASVAEAFGCLYVLEGATLGGQILLRTLGPRLGLTAADGLSFLAGYGPQTGSHWKAFAARSPGSRRRVATRRRCCAGPARPSRCRWSGSPRSSLVVDPAASATGRVVGDLAYGTHRPQQLRAGADPYPQGARTVAEATRALPVVAVTAYAMKGDAEKMLAAGCTAYVPKPINTRALVALVARLLSAPLTPPP